MKKKRERELDAAIAAAAGHVEAESRAPAAAYQWVCSMCGRRSVAVAPTRQRPRCGTCGGTTLLEVSH